mgnify:CR=1 FL=1
MRSIETEGAVAERRTEAFLATHAFRASRGELIEIVEIAR